MQKEEGRQNTSAWLLQQEEGRQILQKESGIRVLGYCGGAGEGPVTLAPAICPGVWVTQSLRCLIMSPRFHIFLASFLPFILVCSMNNLCWQWFSNSLFLWRPKSVYRKLLILRSPLVAFPFCFFTQHLPLCWKSLCTCTLSMFSSGHVPPGSFQDPVWQSHLQSHLLHCCFSSTKDPCSFFSLVIIIILKWQTWVKRKESKVRILIQNRLAFSNEG